MTLIQSHRIRIIIVFICFFSLALFSQTNVLAQTELIPFSELAVNKPSTENVMVAAQSDTITIPRGGTWRFSGASGCSAPAFFSRSDNLPEFLKLTNLSVSGSNGSVRVSFDLNPTLNAPLGFYQIEIAFVLRLSSGAPCGRISFSYVISVVQALAPIAKFDANPRSGLQPLVVEFTDLSRNPITERKWDFGDGQQSDEVNPKHTYTSTGTYSVSLFVFGPGGNDSLFMNDLIRVGIPGTPGIPKWQFEARKEIITSPAITPDGSIVFGTADSGLVALAPDAQQWRFYKTSDIVRFHPTISEEGDVYIATRDGYLYSLNLDGEVKWQFKLPGIKPLNNPTTAPFLGFDGTVYIGGFGTTIIALNPDGQEKQRFQILPNGGITSIPIIGSDGTIYLIIRYSSRSGVSKASLFAVNPDGTEKWNHETLWGDYYQVALANDGTIYFTVRGNLYGINPDGTFKWGLFVAASKSAPVIAYDGTIFIGSEIGKLYAINSDATLKWSFNTGEKILSSPIIGADNNVYIGSNNDNIYSLAEDGSLIWQNKSDDDVDGYITIDANGVLYHTSSKSKKLNAVWSSSQGLADNSWPKVYQNNRNTSSSSNAGPILKLPRDQSSSHSSNVTFQWTNIIGAQNYELQIDTTSNFDSNLLSNYNSEGTNIQVFGLKGGLEYFWRVRAVRSTHLTAWSKIQRFTTSPTTAVLSNTSDIPAAFKLEQNYPNPFNASTMVRFDLPKESFVNLKIYDSLGKEIDILAFEKIPAGTHSKVWKADHFPTGIYYYWLKTAEYSQWRKMVLIK